MSSANVVGIIGEPFSRAKSPDGREWWHYSRAVPKGNFHNRIVILKGDAVVATLAEYYLD